MGINIEFDIRGYIFRKFIAPGRLVIDRPGVIIHNSSGVFHSGDIFSRSIFTFEETYIKLYIDTLKELGKKKTSELWYKIGKDATTKYFLPYSKLRRTPKNREKVIRYFCNHFCGVGMSVMQNVDVDFKKGIFVFTGNNAVPCRGFCDGSYLAGVISGMLSFIFEKNIEAKSMCGECPKECKVIADFSYKTKYIPKKINCPFFNSVVHIPNKEKISSGLSSFSDFLKFGLTKIDSSKKFNILGKTIILMDGSLPNIIVRNYASHKIEYILRKSVVKSSKEIFQIVSSKCESEEQRLKCLRNLFSALGLGEIYFQKNKSGIVVSSLHPFFSKGKPLILSLMIQASIYIIYGKETSLVHETSQRMEYLFK